MKRELILKSSVLNTCDQIYQDYQSFKDEKGMQATQRVRGLISILPSNIKSGKWTLHDDGSGTCSVCNVTQKNVWDMDSWQNFCGHCGADMREDNY